MSDQTYIVILRLLHIGFGLFWAGSAIFFALFLMPSLKTTGPDGVKFMQALGRSGYPIAAMISAIITIFSGFLLIWILSGGFNPIWFRSWYARVLTGGATMSVIAFIIGFTINRPSAARMNKISLAIAAQGTGPTPEQLSEIMGLRKKIFTGTNFIAVLLVLAVAGMSVFRYVG
jgi:hypothetical protein